MRMFFYISCLRDYSDSENVDETSAERSSSPMSDVSTATYIVEHVDGDAVKLEYQSLVSETDSGGPIRPVAFTVPLEGVSNPRKTRPGAVTLASKKGRIPQESITGKEETNPTLLDNKVQHDKSSLEKSPQPAKKATGFLLTGKEDGKENTSIVANSVLSKIQKADSSGKTSSVSNANRSPRSRIQHTHSAGKTKPKVAKI